MATENIFSLNDFLCDLGCGHPVKVFFLLLQSSGRFQQCLILFAHDHHSFRVRLREGLGTKARG